MNFQYIHQGVQQGCKWQKGMQNTALNGNFQFEFEIKSQCFPLFKLIIKVYNCWQEVVSGRQEPCNFFLMCG